MEQYIAYFWLALIVVAAVVEALTAQLVSIWFVVGGVAGMIAYVCGAPIWLQLDLFIVVTALTLLVTRPFVRKLMHFKKVDTNADRYIGKDGIVIAEINNTLGHGQVKVMGSVWTARSVDDSVIPVGADVAIHAIEGVKLIVELKKV
ncbi:MAG TPA: NfeD family protein [Oscillospiraceae bacterium]|nr:NfeD family protein [Oscillospiraceae bacterium]